MDNILNCLSLAVFLISPFILSASPGSCQRQLTKSLNSKDFTGNSLFHFLPFPSPLLPLTYTYILTAHLDCKLPVSSQNHVVRVLHKKKKKRKILRGDWSIQKQDSSGGKVSKTLILWLEIVHTHLTIYIEPHGRPSICKVFSIMGKHCTVCVPLRCTAVGQEYPVLGLLYQMAELYKGKGKFVQ